MKIANLKSVVCRRSRQLPLSRSTTRKWITDVMKLQLPTPIIHASMVLFNGVGGIAISQ